MHAFGPQDYYVEGNVMEGHYGADEPLKGVRGQRNEPIEDFIVDKPFFESYVTTQSAEKRTKTCSPTSAATCRCSTSTTSA